MAYNKTISSRRGHGVSIWISLSYASYCNCGLYVVHNVYSRNEMLTEDVDIRTAKYDLEMIRRRFRFVFPVVL
jgi:hypothetical protein